jgi:hypothetical protein
VLRACGKAIEKGFPKISFTMYSALAGRRWKKDFQISFTMCFALAGETVLSGRLGAVLHAGFGVFLKEVADVDGEAFEFFIESLSRAKAKRFTRFSHIAVVTLERLRYNSTFVVLE